MRAGALALILSVTTGCLTATAPDPGVQVDVPQGLDALKFAEPILLGTFNGASEVNVAVSPSGTIYVASINPIGLWRSDDGGKSYTWIGKPRPCRGVVPDCPVGGRDPGLVGPNDGDLAVTPDGRVHWAGLNASAPPSVPYQVSADRGMNWSAPVDVAFGNDTDREWIYSRPSDGALFVSWRDFGPNVPPLVPNPGLPVNPPQPPVDPRPQEEAPTGILMRASYDGGATWGPTRFVANDTRQGGVVPDPNGGALYIARDELGKMRVHRSFDDGLTWEGVEAASVGPERGHIFPIVSVDLAGNVYLVFAADVAKPTAAPDAPFVGETDRGFEHPNVWMAVSKDKGATWSKPLKLNAEGTTALFPTIAAGADGRVVAAWYENVMGTSLNEVGEWWATAAVSLEATATTPTFKAVKVGSEPMHVGNLCTAGTQCSVTQGDRTLADFFEVAIHPAGYAVIAHPKDADVKRALVSVVASRMDGGPSLL